jgi:histidinol phosphatase-like enzyme
MFLAGPDSWTLRYQNIIPKLKELHDEGYRLVMFSNHSPIGRAVNPESKRNGINQ